MVFVNKDFAVDESFEDFIAQNMRIGTIYRQSYDPSIRFSLSTPRPDSPRPNTTLPDLYVKRIPEFGPPRFLDQESAISMKWILKKLKR